MFYSRLEKIDYFSGHIFLNIYFSKELLMDLAIAVHLKHWKIYNFLKGFDITKVGNHLYIPIIVLINNPLVLKCIVVLQRLRRGEAGGERS